MRLCLFFLTYHLQYVICILETMSSHSHFFIPAQNHNMKGSFLSSSFPFSHLPFQQWEIWLWFFLIYLLSGSMCTCLLFPLLPPHTIPLVKFCWVPMCLAGPLLVCTGPDGHPGCLTRCSLRPACLTEWLLDWIVQKVEGQSFLHVFVLLNLLTLIYIL